MNWAVHGSTRSSDPRHKPHKPLAQGSEHCRLPARLAWWRVRQLGLARILVEQRQPQAPALDTALAALPADPCRRHLRQPADEWV